MLPALWLTSASSTSPELKIREGEQVLGRSADADICLDETFVSGYHARLNWQNGQLTVLDLDSTNGTLVNGVPVVGWTSLTDGDVLEFGGVEATVRLPLSSEPAPSAGPTPPPPPAPSRRRPTGGDSGNSDGPRTTMDLTGRSPQPPQGSEPATGPEAHIDLRTGAPAVDGPEAAPPAGGDGHAPVAEPGEPGGRSFPHVYGSRLGPAVSDRTEPLHDRPLKSAVTLPPTPPTGVSIPQVVGPASHIRRLDDEYADSESDDLDSSGFDFGDDRDGRPSNRFDNKGMRITVGTAIIVFVVLAVAAVIILYLLQ